MNARANTRVTIMRGSGTDDFGDTVDSSAVAATGVLASLIEQTHNTRRRDDRENRTIRTYTLRVGGGVDLLRGDRVRDERTNVVYLVDDVTQPIGLVRTLDKRADLRRIT